MRIAAVDLELNRLPEKLSKATAAVATVTATHCSGATRMPRAKALSSASITILNPSMGAIREDWTVRIT